MIAHLMHNHPMWRKCLLRVLIPLPVEESNKKVYNETRKAWCNYLDKIRIVAFVQLFQCDQDSTSLNHALKTVVKSEWTKLTLMSMRRDPEAPKEHGAGHEAHEAAKQVEWENWLNQCQHRIRGIDNCILVWNAGMAVVGEA